MKHTVFLALGGNLGNREQLLSSALSALQITVGALQRQSSIYETAAWGHTTQPNFLNQVVCLTTDLSPMEVLLAIQQIESSLGRVRQEHWGARTMDIDILLYDDLVMQTPLLNIPHPYMAQRRFVLAPLAEIANDYLHPQLQKNIADLLSECEDALLVQVYASK